MLYVTSGNKYKNLMLLNGHSATAHVNEKNSTKCYSQMELTG